MRHGAKRRRQDDTAQDGRRSAGAGFGRHSPWREPEDGLCQQALDGAPATTKKRIRALSGARRPGWHALDLKLPGARRAASRREKTMSEGGRRGDDVVRVARPHVPRQQPGPRTRRRKRHGRRAARLPGLVRRIRGAYTERHGDKDAAHFAPAIVLCPPYHASLPVIWCRTLPRSLPTFRLLYWCHSDVVKPYTVPCFVAAVSCSPLQSYGLLGHCHPRAQRYGWCKESVHCRLPADPAAQPPRLPCLCAS